MKKRVYLTAAVLVTVFIFFNSAQNSEVSGAQSGALLDMLKCLPVFGSLTQTILRKSAHFCEFMCQGVCITAYFSETGKGRRDRAVYTAFFGLLTACTDEFLQLFSQGRSSEVKDVFIDFGGTLAAILIFNVIRYIKRNGD